MSPRLLAITLFGLLLGSTCKKNPSGNAGTLDTRFLPDINIVFADYERADSAKTYAEFAHKLVWANRDLQSSEIYIEAASLYDLAGEEDSVVVLLHKAIDKGMANPRILSKFNGISTIPETEIWRNLQLRLDSIQDKLQHVGNFSLEMDAMNQFWDYFERAKKDTGNAKKIFKEFIFNGPPELRDFYAVRYHNTDAMFGQMINAAPEYYSYLQKQFNADSLRALKATTVAWMQQFHQLYPEAVFPKVYVVPGILNSGGTATEMGLFVGGDMYGKSKNMPAEELTDWQRNAVMEFSSLPGLTLHELMHFQQNYGDTANSDKVIYKLVEEGVCDFLVELSSGIALKNENLEYLQDTLNRQRILTDLKNELFSEDLSKWMYNGGSITDRPHDLGYTLGYLISKSYYARQKDKRRAVYDLLNTHDMESIIKGSDYAHLLDRSL